MSENADQNDHQKKINSSKRYSIGDIGENAQIAQGDFVGRIPSINTGGGIFVEKGAEIKSRLPSTEAKGRRTDPDDDGQTETEPDENVDESDPAQSQTIYETVIHGDNNIVYIQNELTLPARISLFNEQIYQLKGKISRLIPAENNIAILELLRLNQERDVSEEETTKKLLNGYLQQVRDIEARVEKDLSEEELKPLYAELNPILDEINIRLAILHNKFIHLVSSATSVNKVVENLVLNIGHKDLNLKAAVLADAIKELSDRLKLDGLLDKLVDTDEAVRILEDSAYRSVGLIIEIERKRIEIEELLKEDIERRSSVVRTITYYIVGFLILVIAVTSLFALLFQNRQLSLSQQILPFIGVPWPVLTWSFIGSVAAMIHQFNRQPIHDFGDAIKRLITRPVQGMVLGSAFYFVLSSGIFLITNGGSQIPESGSADAFILTLTFLVGFSDRFGDAVFNSLVRRYSPDNEEGDKS